MNKNEIKVCEECVYYDAIGSNSGFCHRFPPTQSAIKGKIDEPPQTKFDNWCGEYKSK